ncbi:MAG: folylpolyglutamate synthase/dihydrofolate synthase family protein [Nanoarchaeota archaeon]
MNYGESIAFIDSLGYKGWKPGLERIQNLLSLIGNPEKKMHCVLIAGTNGKGSTAAMLSTILWKAGIKTARFTSPHLINYNERFWVNGQTISDDEFAQLTTKHKSAILESGATAFEALTAMAYAFFEENKTEIAVMEIGLGGRLDATNVVVPLVSIITNVSMEHESWLGNTIEEITREKAGIIKENTPMITSATGKSLEVIKDIAEMKHAPLIIPEPINYEINLPGEVQKKNMALAYAAIQVLRKQFTIPESAVKHGLMNVHWPGRLQTIGNFILDCAHTPEAVESILPDIPEGITAIVGMLKDKKHEKIIQLLSQKVSRFIFTQPKSDRAMPAEELAKYCKKPYTIKTTLEEAMHGNKELILIVGSCYIVGEVLKNRV